MQPVVRLFQIACVLLLVVSSVASQGRIRRRDVVQKRAFFAVAVDNFAATTGSLIEGRGGPPWLSADVAATEGGRFMRRFGRILYVVNTDSGSITVLRRDGTLLQTIDLGPGSAPMDVCFVAPRTVYITRRDDPFLLRYDLVTRTGSDVADLSLLAAGNESVGLRMLELDGDRLFVQVDLRGPSGESRGALGMVAATTGQLLDVDPVQPGLQGIELAGAPPRLRMQVLDRTLFVSTTGNRLDNRGGIERVDLDSLSLAGFALTEEQAGGVDLGGFVMLSADEGYGVAHTDIVASTHLYHFTVADGVTPGPDLVTLLGDAVESLAHDAQRQRLYLPTGFASFGSRPGVHVLDTRTGLPLPGSPITTEARVHDVVVGR